MKVKIPGYSTVTGTPVAILRIMQDARMIDNLSGDDLIEEISRTAWRAFGIGLQVTGETYEQRAESLLREMNQAHMIEIEED